MPISGLVLTLKQDQRTYPETLQRLQQAEAITLGPVNGQKAPLVLETATPQENKRWLKWLELLPGVHHLDVVYVSLEEESSEIEATSHSNEERQQWRTAL